MSICITQQKLDVGNTEFFLTKQKEFKKKNPTRTDFKQPFLKWG